MAAANLVLRFLLEVAAIVALAYAGWRIPEAQAARWTGAIAAPTVFVVLWGLVAAPKRANGLSQRHKDVIGTVLLLVAAAGLALAGRPALAIASGVVVIANAALLLRFGPGAREAFEGVAR